MTDRNGKAVHGAIQPHQISDAIARIADEAYYDTAGDNPTMSDEDIMKHAIAAALNAWPMATTENREVLNFGNNIDGPIVSAKRVPFIVLPLMENTNDKA